MLANLSIPNKGEYDTQNINGTKIWLEIIFPLSDFKVPFSRWDHPLKLNTRIFKADKRYTALFHAQLNWNLMPSGVMKNISLANFNGIW